MIEHIWNDKDGTLLARMEDGKIFQATNNKQFAVVHDGKIYGMDGTCLGDLTVLTGSTTGETSEIFCKRAKGEDG